MKFQMSNSYECQRCDLAIVSQNNHIQLADLKTICEMETQMTPEERRLWALSSAHSAKRRKAKSEGAMFDFLGIAFIVAILLIILFVALAGQSV